MDKPLNSLGIGARSVVPPGLDARSAGEVCIEVPYGGDEEAAADDLLAQTEHLITSLGAPFVPIKHEGVIYISPPAN